MSARVPDTNTAVAKKADAWRTCIKVGSVILRRLDNMLANWRGDWGERAGAGWVRGCGGGGGRKYRIINTTATPQSAVLVEELDIAADIEMVLVPWWWGWWRC